MTFESVIITLPIFGDKEGDLPIKVSTFEKGKRTLPNFVQFD
jgi:hypothetical protein